MNPPSFVVEGIEKIHKYARLGWRGLDKRPDEETLNKGFFYLLQLYHKRDVLKNALAAEWTHGPVYGSPYDINVRTPVMIAKLSHDDIFKGLILEKLRYWMIPMQRRTRDSALEAGKAYAAKVHDLAEGQADFMLWHNSKTWQNATTNRTTTFTDLTEHDKAVLRGEAKPDLTQAFMPHAGSVV